MLAEVIERRRMTLASVTSANALTIVTDHLRPALDETLEEVRPAVDALEPFDISSPDRFVNAAPDVRAAYGVLCDLAERYRAIRAARGAYRDELKPEYTCPASSETLLPGGGCPEGLTPPGAGVVLLAT